MDRRMFVTMLAGGVLVAPRGAEAQTARKRPAIAVLYVAAPVADLSGASPKHSSMRAFLEGMREFGWVDGQNIAIERRSAEGRADRYAALVHEMLDLKVDVLVVSGALPFVLAAQQATRTIPIVMVGLSGDPVGAGLARSLAAPGGNVTGSATEMGGEMSGKRLGLLKEAAPRISRVAFLYQPGNAPSSATESAARALNLTLLAIRVDASQSIATTLAEIAKTRADALYVSGGTVLRFWPEIIEFAAANRLPAVANFLGYAKAGGLMDYAVSYDDLFRRAAAYVNKILKGARPGELPIEQPTKFELNINLKTAKALGLIIPPSLLLRADQVIE